jgi:hypothetical protein
LQARAAAGCRSAGPLGQGKASLIVAEAELKGTELAGDGIQISWGVAGSRLGHAAAEGLQPGRGALQQSLEASRAWLRLLRRGLRRGRLQLLPQAAQGLPLGIGVAPAAVALGQGQHGEVNRPLLAALAETGWSCELWADVALEGEATAPGPLRGVFSGCGYGDPRQWRELGGPRPEALAGWGWLFHQHSASALPDEEQALLAYNPERYAERSSGPACRPHAQPLRPTAAHRPFRGVGHTHPEQHGSRSLTGDRAGYLGVRLAM